MQPMLLPYDLYRHRRRRLCLAFFCVAAGQFFAFGAARVGARLEPFAPNSGRLLLALCAAALVGRAGNAVAFGAAGVGARPEP